MTWLFPDSPRWHKKLRRRECQESAAEAQAKRWWRHVHADGTPSVGGWHIIPTCCNAILEAREA